MVVRALVGPKLVKAGWYCYHQFVSIYPDARIPVCTMLHAATRAFLRSSRSWVGLRIAVRVNVDLLWLPLWGSPMGTLRRVRLNSGEEKRSQPHL